MSPREEEPLESKDRKSNIEQYLQPARALAEAAVQPEEGKLFNDDPLLTKAVDFTDLEDVCLAVWLEAVLRGRLADAAAILSTGLLAEHYRSLLSENEGDITPPQRMTMQRLRDEFKAALDAFRKPVPRPEPEPRDREPGSPRER